MSAYAGEKGNNIISISSSDSHAGLRDSGSDTVPSNLLAQFGNELQAFFSNSRKLEEALANEKLSLKKHQEELQRLRSIYSRLLQDAKNKQKEFLEAECSLKSQISAYQASETVLKSQIELLQGNEKSLHEKNIGLVNQLKSELIQYQLKERSILDKFKAAESAYYELKKHYSILYQRTESIKRQFQDREEEFKSQIKIAQKQAKDYQDQIQQLNQALLNSELLKANLGQLKQSELAYQDTIQQLKAHAQNHLNQAEDYKRKLHAVWKVLAQYKEGWSKMTSMIQKARKLEDESLEQKNRIEELKEAISAGKRGQDRYEELYKKERSEKQVALTCLHTAEARLAHANRELEELKNKIRKKIEEPSLELEF